MARIRTIKPEFWDSPSVAKASPWARLLFIAMWNWADDYGRGTANLKELEGFAFPNDDEFTDRSGNTVTFRSLVAEVSECFGVLLYEVDGRRYYEIPTWDSHQRNEKRAKQSKHPDPPVFQPNNEDVAEIPSQCAGDPRSSVPGTGEQGNRGTGEQYSLSAEESTDRKTLIPEDWQPNEKHKAHAKSLNIDVDYVARKFVEHANRTARRLVKWDTAFTNWMNKGVVINQQRGRAPARSSALDHNMGVVAELEAEYGQGELEQ